MRTVLWLAIAVLLAGCTSLTTLYFYPQNIWLSTPSDASLEYQDVFLKAQDGTQLHAWYLPAQAMNSAENSNIMVLYLHGNAENISTHAHSIYWLPKSGVSVLALDYRGFGASQGQALLPYVLQDIEAATKWLREQFPDKKLFILAQSIGTALALDFTAAKGAQYQVQALILDAPFTGFPAVARAVLSQSFLGWLIWPFTVFLPARYDPIKVVDAITVPVLIMHSKEDRVIPYQQGRALYQALKQHNKLAIWQDATGPHVASFADPQLRQKTLQFILTN